MKKLFYLSDRLVNIILIGCILVIVFTLIVLFKISNGFTKENEVKEINEHYENMSETECLSLQLRCYRENIGSSEEEILEKCKEINFCL